MKLAQLDLFGGAKAHDIVEKERRDQEYRERLRSDHNFAVRALILNCLNRRGPMSVQRMVGLLGLAPLDVKTSIAELRDKGLVVEVGQEDHAWIWKATAKREEGTC